MKTTYNQNIMTTSNKPPILFWVISVLAFIWNALGCLAYLGQKMMTQEDLNMMPEAERALYTDIPLWATAVFAIGVWFGLLGSLFLLIRKKWAKPVFVISLLGVLGQMFYNLALSPAYEVYGTRGLIMPVMIALIGVFLILYSNRAIKKGWLK